MIETFCGCEAKELFKLAIAGSISLLAFLDQTSSSGIQHQRMELPGLSMPVAQCTGIGLMARGWITGIETLRSINWTTLTMVLSCC